jgi:ferric-dicitrate binding protein FerR (iron transport regulator)
MLFSSKYAGDLRALALGFAACMIPTAPVAAQSGGCKLFMDQDNGLQKILRCGDTLAVRASRDARYRLVPDQKAGVPRALKLDAGAVLIEFEPSAVRKDFQILTPHAIAAVRGTKWAVELKPDQTSTLVLFGAVGVSRRNGKQGVILHQGEGVDVTAKPGPLEVKNWKPARVQGLLSRFGQ